MARAKSNGIELEYDTFGDSSDGALLLVSGFATQMIGWDLDFCRLLADAGFRVIRFDNRDVGLSSRISGSVDLPALFAGTLRSAPYGLEEMADDAVGLLDALGIGAAHVVGSSMGGMIAQTLAIRHPQRVSSLCSMMSTTGSPSEAARRGVDVGRVIGSPSLFDEARAARRAVEAYERAHDPHGVARQLAAVGTQVDRTPALRRLILPTLVIHGALDPVFDVSGGEATAEAITGARLLVVDDMGHDLAEPLWPQIAAAITANARRAPAR